MEQMTEAGRARTRVGMRAGPAYQAIGSALLLIWLMSFVVEIGTAAGFVIVISIPLLLLGLLFRGLRNTPTPQPEDARLTGLQRFGAEQTRAAARMSSGMVKLGLAGIAAGGLGLLVAYLPVDAG